MKPVVRFVFLAGCMLYGSAALAQPAVNPGNGHAYQVIYASAMNFEQARAYAQSLSHGGGAGYLVSITSAEEQAFVASLSPPKNAWIGGFQADNSVEPAAGWTWITGEEWDYTNWAANEPNDNGGDEDCAHWWDGNGWNDIPCTYTYSTLVVEWDRGFKPVPATSRPALVLLMGLVLLLGAALIRSRA